MRLFLLAILLCSFSSCNIEGRYLTIETTKNAEQIIVDGKFTRVSEIPYLINEKIAELDSLERSRFFVKLIVNKETKMGTIYDIRNLLRKSNIDSINHYTLTEKDKRTKYLMEY